MRKIILIMIMIGLANANDWKMQCNPEQVMSAISDDFVVPLFSDKDFEVSYIVNKSIIDPKKKLIYVWVMFLATPDGNRFVDNIGESVKDVGYFKIFKEYNYKDKTYRNSEVDFYNCDNNIILRSESSDNFEKINNDLDKMILSSLIKDYNLK